MATSASNAFSGSGEDAIGRQIEVEADTTADHLNSHQEFENYYEIDRTVDQIVKGGYQRVSQSNTSRTSLILIISQGRPPISR